MAVSRSVAVGSSSYSTSMSSAASWAMRSSVAATAATASPTKRARSSASGYSSGVHGMIPKRSGMSLPVMTATTPRRASARDGSIRTMRACGCGQRRRRPQSMRGRWMSSV